MAGGSQAKPPLVWGRFVTFQASEAAAIRAHAERVVADPQADAAMVAAAIGRLASPNASALVARLNFGQMQVLRDLVRSVHERERLGRDAG